jgi:glyoxylase-like metal-dependent hydrolase (beta-lactamase superfamily II)
MAQALSEAARLADHGVARLRAENPGPLTLSGTNTWLVGCRPTWVVDPGPLISDRGGLGGVLLTHDHRDHRAAVEAVLREHPAPLAAGRGDVDLTLHDGVRFGPFQAVITPGHAADHFAAVAHGACFTGDAVLGEGSVFIAPYRGAMAAYLHALKKLRQRTDFGVICPGHGPPVWDPHAKLAECVEHRLDRERALLNAIRRGMRGERELLDAVWLDVPAALRSLARVTLAAHLDKLEDEGLLPEGVQRPAIDAGAW